MDVAASVYIAAGPCAIAMACIALGSVGLGMLVAWEMGPKRCPHLDVRCVHGDEINALNSRRVCRDCGTALDGPLPEPCSVSGEPHWSASHALRDEPSQ